MMKVMGVMAVGAAIALPVLAQQDEATVWSVTPYLWAFGLDGDVGVGGRTAEVSADFGDVVDNMDMGFAIMGDVRRGAWGLHGDFTYLDLSTAVYAAGLKATVEQTAILGELDATYVVKKTEDSMIEVLAGGRINDQELTIGLSGIGEETRDKSWVDPVIGLRGQVKASGKFSLGGRADIGGFGVASDLTWQLLGYGAYAITENLDLSLGYRYLATDYEDGGFTYDAATHGFILGLTIKM
jgi:opacity protein-like surface antigen